MATLPIEPFYSGAEIIGRPPPPQSTMRWRKALFGNVYGAGLTAIIAWLAFILVSRFIHWALIAGVWRGGPAACEASGGACWAFLVRKSPVILFGLYPPEQQWRPIALVLLVLALAVWTLPPRHWRLPTLGAWAAGIVIAITLMAGGVLGLPFVPTSAWGGLPITLLLTIISLALGFPLGIALALGRRSHLPGFRLVSIGIIEIIRAIPLLTLLFVASILLPLMLPAGVTVDNLLRALVTFTIYAGVYIAEVMRAGLDDVSQGQFEATYALGLTKFQALRLIILPQAILKIIPALTNTIVVLVKDTGLVLVVGLFDLLTAARTALSDPAWPFPYAEAFLFVSSLYFVICFSISCYSRFLERRLSWEGLR